MKQIGRLGTSIFTLRELKAEISGHVMVPVSELNEVRRKCVEQLEKMRLADFQAAADKARAEAAAAVRAGLANFYSVIEKTASENIRSRNRGETGITVVADDLAKLSAALEGGADRIVFGGENYRHEAITLPMYEMAVKLAKTAGGKVVFNTPRIIRDGELDAFHRWLENIRDMGADGISIHNIGSLYAARMMTDILTGVMETGTGRNLKLSQMPCAGKTGTTNDLKDGWFCGFTRYYTTSVWVGCDIPEPVTGLTGSSYPGTIWNTYMENIHQGLAVLDFLPYAQLSDEFVENHNAQNPENDNENAQNEDPDENVGENPQNAEIGENSGENPQNAETGENAGETSQNAVTGGNTADNPQNAGTGENTGDSSQNAVTDENAGENPQNAGVGGNTGDNLPNAENIEGTDPNAGNVVGP